MLIKTGGVEMKTGFKKVFREMMLYKGRTLLTLAGVLIGITSVGAVLSAYSILTREMNRNFMDTNPSSIVLNVTNMDDKASSLIKQSSRDVDIELRKTIQARISRGDGTYGTVFLRAIPDFENQKVDSFTLEKGSFPANSSQLAIERGCLKILANIKEGVGENVSIKLPGGLEKEMLLSGRVHAPGLAPASMETIHTPF
jgi:putative ABC transport system permease protein